jgi:hypothetical protein
MTRKLRIEYAGAFYHVMNRGDRQEPTFDPIANGSFKPGGLGWEEADLGERRKGDEEKVRLARRLRRETTVSMRWIAQQL